MTQNAKTNRLYTSLGLFLFTCALISLLAEIFAFKQAEGLSEDLPPFMRIQLQIVSSIFFATLAAAGLVIMRGQRAAFINLTLSLLTILLFCGLGELILRSSYFQDPQKNKTIWIPPALKERDLEITRHHYERADKHPYGFNDTVKTISKPAGKKRIAVLGDSFVWGEGLPYDQSWNHLLERKIVEKYPQIEVLSWGKRGWDTWHEFQFLKMEGIKNEIDYLIVGFVENDPDWANITQKNFIWQGALFLRPIHSLFPNLLDFVITYINNILEKRFFKDYGYEVWLEKLYSDENLDSYGFLLKEFSEFCRNKKITLLFVLTPHGTQENERGHFEKIVSLLQAASIPYFNLFSLAFEHFHTIPDRQLWANPANSHPGPLLTHLFANRVFDYLEEEKILQQLSP